VPALGDLGSLHQVALGPRQRHRVTGEGGTLGQVRLDFDVGAAARLRRVLGILARLLVNRRGLRDVELFQLLQPNDVFVDGLDFGFQRIERLGLGSVGGAAFVQRLLHDV
jgi:hypothetical protein